MEGQRACFTASIWQRTTGSWIQAESSKPLVTKILYRTIHTSKFHYNVLTCTPAKFETSWYAAFKCACAANSHIPWWWHASVRKCYVTHSVNSSFTLIYSLINVCLVACCQYKLNNHVYEMNPFFHTYTAGKCMERIWGTVLQIRMHYQWTV